MEAALLRARWRSWQTPTDWLVACALAAAGLADVIGTRHDATSYYTGGRVLVAALTLLAFLPLGVRRRFPLEVLLMVLVATLVVELALAHASQQGPLQDFLAWLIVSYSFAAYADRRRLFVGMAALVVAGAVYVSVTLSAGQAAGSVLPPVLLAGFAWVIGRTIHRRQQLVDVLGERTEQLEREREHRARAAVSEERGRIARELHDVVAHSVSVMVVQAQAGQRLLTEPERAAATLRSIENSGREALVELRRLLGILRSGGEQLAIGPQPGLGSLTSLVEQLAAAGLPVDVAIEGGQSPLPPGIDLAAYRIVQEALTNALKHAGQARASVVVRYTGSMLELDITDDGQGPRDVVNGAGHGLIGMRERASLYGGSLHVGPGPERGYAVHAMLPLARDAE